MGAVLVAALLLTALVVAPRPRTRSGSTPEPEVELPTNQAGRGLVYDGLQRDTRGGCASGFEIGSTGRCTHGPDPAPEGFDIASSMPPHPAPAAPEVAAARCDADGAIGSRTEVAYVRASDRPDRFEAYLPSFRTWAADSDRIYQASAAKTGGHRNIRFVHDGACNITIRNLVVPPEADDDLNKTIAALETLGFNRPDRKYVLFVDANIYCGIGGTAADDRPGPDNANNRGPSYARVDAGCWSGRTVAHEHMHTLGAVQLSAPHASGGFHCVDENDVMCYSDRPNHPNMRVVCPGVSTDTLFDCNDDDYFNTNPPAGSYLATRWNTANSQFLSSSAPPAMTVSSASVSEGDSGVSTAVFTITLSSAPASPVTVQVTTSDGTAVAASDYVATTGTVTFPAGTTTQTVAVNVVGDTTTEPNETFSVNLADPVGATLASAHATGTIADDDTQRSPADNAYVDS